jgi:hypothetical protein
MRKISKIIITVAIIISIICIAIIIYKNQNDTLNNIKAEYYNISFGKSYYEGIDKVEQSTTDLLVKDYNKIKIIGTTNQEINYDKSICIIFVNNDQISGQVTIDNTGICHIGGKPDNYIIDNQSNIYEDGIKAHEELKEKFKS